MANDFFGDYVAPGMVIAGAGVTAYRTYKDVSKKGTLTSPWRAQREASALYKGVMAARAERNFKTAEQVASLFYPGAGAESAAEAIDLIRGSTVKGLVRSFNLDKTAIGLGINLDNPASVTKEQLTALIGGSAENPLGTRFYREHLERVASYNKLNAITPSGLQGASKRGQSALDKLTKAYSQIQSDNGAIMTVGKLKEEGGFALTSATGRQSPVSYIRGKKEFQKAFAGREGLTSRVHELYKKIQEINKTSGLSAREKMSMKLITMEEGGKMFHTGIRITSNKKSMDLVLEDENRIVRWGKNGKSRGVAKYVAAADIEKQMQGQILDPFKLTRRVDEYQLDWALGGGLDKFRQGSVKGNSFFKKLLSGFREDSSKPILRLTAEDALNRRVASTLVLTNSGLSKDQIQTLKNKLIDQGVMDPTVALSANQATSDNIAMPTRTGHVMGAGPIGLGDNKSMSQVHRGKPFRKHRGIRRNTPALTGVREAAAGDVKARYRFGSAPESFANTYFSMTNRADLHLHEDEVLIGGRNKGYKDAKTLGSFGPDSPVSQKISKLARAETGPMADLAMRLREGMPSEHLEGMLEERSQLKKLLGETPDVDSAEFKKFTELDEALETITMRPGDFVGVGPDGRITTIPDTAKSFYLTKMSQDIENGKPTLSLSGEIHGVVGDGDKIFGTKGIIKGKTDSEYLEKLTALYEANKYDPKLIAAIKDGDTAAIEEILRPQLEHINSAQDRALAAGKKFRLKDAFKGTAVSKRWRRAVEAADGVEFFEVQGIKKMGDDRMGELTQGLMEELVDEGLEIHERKLPALNDRTMELLLDPDRPVQVDPNNLLQQTSPAYGTRAKIREQELSKLEMKRAVLEERLNSIRKLGFTYGGETGTHIIDNGKYNMVDRFEQAVELTMRSPGRRGKWSPQQFFKDLSQSKRLAAFGDHIPDILAAAKGTLLEAGETYKKLRAANAFVEGPAREEWLKALSSPAGGLRHSTLNRTVGYHGNPAQTSGSGRQGSFSAQTLAHTQAQGGVVAEMGMELSGRLISDNLDEAREVWRRNAYFDSKESFKSVSIKELGQSDLSRGTIEDLFSPNQEERNKAFKTVKDKFGLAEADDLVFDTGSEANKYIYHPQAISKHTGGFTTESGIHQPTGIDVATKEMIMNARAGNKEYAVGVSAYGEELAQISVGNTQVTKKAFSGHVQGSLRLQARSNTQKKFFSGLGDYIDENYAHKVGIKESLVDQMIEDMGIQGDRDEIIGQLRKGELASLIHRSPDTEMHRISSVQMFSIDDVLEKYATKVAGTKTSPELITEIWRLSKYHGRKLSKKLEALEKVVQSQNEEIAKGIDANLSQLYGYKNKAEEAGRGNKKSRRLARQQLKAEVARVNSEYGYKIGLNKKGTLNSSSLPKGMDLEVEKRKLLTRELADFYKDQHKGTFVWAPKQIEQVLGLDYDDDHISIFLSKKKSTRDRLQARSSYQEKLLKAWDDTGGWGAPGNVDLDKPQKLIESMRPSQGMLAEEYKAEEDFFYKKNQEELYRNLKPENNTVLKPGDIEPGSPLWKARARAKDQMAQLEKAKIGGMSNATDFARAIHRRTSGSTQAGAHSRLFAEMLMGIMPESILKVRQVPMGEVSQVGDDAAYIERALRGQTGTSENAVQEFQNRVRSLHRVKEGTIVDRIASKEHIKIVLEGAEKAAASDEFNLVGALNAMDPSPEARARMMNAARDPMASSMFHELYRDSSEGVTKGISSMERNIRNTAVSFSDAYDIMLKHKKPLLLGAGLAIATSMLLGSPGSISSEEADAAGARHSSGEPTTPPTDMGHSARVATNSGRAVRVRGSSNGDIDPSVIAAKLGERFPGSSVNFTVNDYRERINQEYIRKKLDR